MKTLTLLRHAKSTWDDPVARDFDRPLNKRGQKAARRIGEEMKALGLAFDTVLASPAARVIETLEDVSAGYGAKLEAAFDRRVYLAPADLLLELIRGTDDGGARLLLVGHNPGLENLLLMLTGEASGALRAEAAIKYPTATLAEIGLPVEHWSDVKAGIGTVNRFVRPRDLDPELGPDEAD